MSFNVMTPDNDCNSIPPVSMLEPGLRYRIRKRGVGLNPYSLLTELQSSPHCHSCSRSIWFLIDPQSFSSRNYSDYLFNARFVETKLYFLTKKKIYIYIYFVKRKTNYIYCSKRKTKYFFLQVDKVACSTTATRRTASPASAGQILRYRHQKTLFSLH